MKQFMPKIILGRTLVGETKAKNKEIVERWNWYCGWMYCIEASAGIYEST
jgi:hypothetical protein